MIRASVSGLLSLLILAAVSPATAGDVSADEVSIATYQAAIKVNSLDEAIAAALANEPQRFNGWSCRGAFKVCKG